MNIIRKWRIESGHTFRKMGQMLGGFSAGHLNNVYQGKSTLNQVHSKRAEEILRLELLIKENVPDKILVQYELDLLLKKFRSNSCA